MALSRSRWAVLILLVALGLYFLIFHKAPLPLNHESIGLGQLHIVHDAIAIALFAAAGFLLYMGRRSAPAPVPGAS